jgi:hypothetical protein
VAARDEGSCMRVFKCKLRCIEAGGLEGTVAARWTFQEVEEGGRVGVYRRLATHAAAMFCCRWQVCAAFHARHAGPCFDGALLCCAVFPCMTCLFY